VAGELGHVDVGGEVACGCGARGCLEGWLGTEGLRRRAEAQGLAIDDGAELFARADDDERAERLVSEAVDALARGLRTLLVVFAPEVLAFAGGLSLARPRLQPAVDRAVAAAIPAAVDQLEVRWLGRADELAIAGAVETP
jgi:glucokinase